ncbi:hypothetical protein [Frankia tisae]|uniref:hypothetical protein n=1 Tax=Frankia tisae TaxID=2950104 RepID=UPI0021BE399F|nr:hypothetical protein [Frankia tisae]
MIVATPPGDAPSREPHPAVTEVRAQLHRLADGRPRTLADEREHERRRRAGEVSRGWA